MLGAARAIGVSLERCRCLHKNYSVCKRSTRRERARWKERVEEELRALPASSPLRQTQRRRSLLQTAKMDRQPTYSLSLFTDNGNEHGDQTNKQVQQELVDFIMQFHIDTQYIYR